MASKRELIEPKGDKRYIRRDERAALRRAMTSAARLPQIAGRRRRRSLSPDRETRAIANADRRLASSKSCIGTAPTFAFSRRTLETLSCVTPSITW